MKFRLFYNKRTIPQLTAAVLHSLSSMRQCIICILRGNEQVFKVLSLHITTFTESLNQWIRLTLGTPPSVRSRLGRREGNRSGLRNKIFQMRKKCTQYLHNHLPVPHDDCGRPPPAKATMRQSTGPPVHWINIA